MRRMAMVARGALAVLAPAVAALALAAALPDAVQKLSGSSEDSAKAVMAQNGYVVRSEKSSWGRHLTYWWSDRARQCVELMSVAGRVLAVYAKGESDCAATAGAGASGGLIDPAQLVGLPRKAAEARLTAAGFNALSIDESKVDAIYIWWYNGRQCLAATIIGDRYDMLASMPMNNCRK